MKCILIYYNLIYYKKINSLNLENLKCLRIVKNLYFTLNSLVKNEYLKVVDMYGKVVRQKNGFLKYKFSWINLFKVLQDVPTGESEYLVNF